MVPNDKTGIVKSQMTTNVILVAVGDLKDTWTIVTKNTQRSEIHIEI